MTRTTELKIGLKRLLAFLVDALIVTLALTISGLVLFLLNVSFGYRHFFGFLGLVVLLYFWLIPASFHGVTLGKKVTGLGVTMGLQSRQLGFSTTYLRFLLAVLPTAAGFMLTAILMPSTNFDGYAFIELATPILAGALVLPVSLVISPRSGLHDRIAGTEVTDGLSSQRRGRALPIWRLTLLSISYALIVALGVTAVAANAFLKGDLTRSVLPQSVIGGDPNNPFTRLIETDFRKVPLPRNPGYPAVLDISVIPFGPQLPVFSTIPSKPESTRRIYVALNTYAWSWISAIGVFNDPAIFTGSTRAVLATDVGYYAYRVMNERYPFIWVALVYYWQFGPFCYNETGKSVVIVGVSGKAKYPIFMPPHFETLRTVGFAYSPSLVSAGYCTWESAVIPLW